ncbi:MAG: zinc ribbon domain-containing protein [Victivallales bacterium]|nr:zinc ribbon domain-containing protein [Victivallales bacterium]
MFRCPKCGTDNMLTAIFCRGCGERLNLDEIRPDDFANITPKKQDNTKQNIIGGAIIVGLALLFLVDWMCPACGKISVTEDDAKDAAAKILGEAMVKGTSFTVDDKQATAMFKETMGDIPCTVHFLEDGKCKAIFSLKLWGMPTDVAVTHPISAVNGKISVEPSGEDEGKSYRLGLGLIPMFESLRESEEMTSAWSTYSGAWGKIPVQGVEVQVEAGKITFSEGKGSGDQGGSED